MAKLNVWRRLSAQTIFLHQAIADHLGLNVTDHKCLDILWQGGPMTAGALAEASGLTTGAITGVVDRLERKGFVRRAADPADRRKTVVEIVPEEVAALAGLFSELGKRTERLLSEYDADERQVIEDFIARTADLVDTFVARLKESR
jgi:DNA-binding MarR family transcriptional regulator